MEHDGGNGCGDCGGGGGGANGGVDGGPEDGRVTTTTMNYC